MIYLKRSAERQEVYIPATIAGAPQKLAVRLTLRGTVSLMTEAESVTDEGGRRDYYVVHVMLPEGVAAGEYEYRLTFFDVELASGVAVVGEAEFAAERIEYKTAVNYEQYETK